MNRQEARRTLMRQADALARRGFDDAPGVAEAIDVLCPEGDATHTPNGFDPVWLEAINRVLEDRGSEHRAPDLDDELWHRYLGPLCDEFESGYVLNYQNEEPRR
jgi:hypothetical protein